MLTYIFAVLVPPLHPVDAVAGVVQPKGLRKLDAHAIAKTALGGDLRDHIGLTEVDLNPLLSGALAVQLGGRTPGAAVQLSV